MDAPRELPRLAFSLAAVLLIAAGLLRFLDGLPALLLGRPRRVTEHPSVEAAERRLATRLLRPTYFPEALAWPPRTVRSVGGASPAVALGFEGRRGSGARLVLCQTLRGGDSIPERLLPRGRVTHTVNLTIRGAPAQMNDVVTGHEGPWQDLVLRCNDRRVTLRFQGPAELFVRLAESLRAEPAS